MSQALLLVERVYNIECKLDEIIRILAEDLGGRKAFGHLLRKSISAADVEEILHPTTDTITDKPLEARLADIEAQFVAHRDLIKGLMQLKAAGDLDKVIVGGYYRTEGGDKAHVSFASGERSWIKYHGIVKHDGEHQGERLVAWGDAGKNASSDRWSLDLCTYQPHPFKE